MVNIIRNVADIEEGLAALVRIDARLAEIARQAGPLPLRLSEPGFAGLAHIIVSQVVSRASANAIWQRIGDAVGDVTAQTYLAVATPEVPQFGLSRAKARTLHHVAVAIVEGRLDLDALNTLDEAKAFAQLMTLKGVGPWTAQVYLMFCCGYADIFPHGDVALQAAVARAFHMQTRPSAKSLGEIACQWAPWRSVAARLFWSYYASVTRRDAVPIA
ncbi:DNA-3-methyladenine glycosylase II [Rhizobium skierniewicense]|uniref:DNA-3-methyladenine glycosylase II n=1 Tax=Rhizobium skierniewicense TaxID=984260 RepID=A0A7W6CD24_9HYPH|nr:DNA-3-methyladenine glycosylase 2 family protein [Rhizobium skierniewicense]MBB3948193.1 DNA-3-methyladenine glycosylase II [Rhizobium skierniewicense]